MGYMKSVEQRAGTGMLYRPGPLYPQLPPLEWNTISELVDIAKRGVISKNGNDKKRGKQALTILRLDRQYQALQINENLRLLKAYVRLTAPK